MMLVCHGVAPYEESWAGGLYRAYARHVPVVYVDPDSPRGWPGRARALGRSLAAESASGDVVRIGLPALVPGNRVALVSAVNRWIATQQLLGALRGAYGGDVVLIVQRPDFLPTLHGLPSTLTVYEVVDDYVALAGDAAAARRMRRAHRRALKESDLVWATSAALAADIRPDRPDVIASTNGVDYDLFSRGRGSAPALATIPRPRIGLVGRLNDRVDWELVEAVCRRRPEWSFVLVGPVYCAGRDTQEGLGRLLRHPNVHRAGAVREDEMPDSIASLDVCLIPYRLVPMTSGINPLKVYQYLAAGKPVVATALSSLEGLDPDVAIGRDVESFEAAIAAALAVKDDAAACLRRRARARAFDWDNVASARLRSVRDRLAAAVRAHPARIEDVGA